MDKVKILDKSFGIFIEEKTIKDRIAELGKEISADFKGETPVFLGILNGSFMFASDLLQNISIDCKISFLKLASYQGTTSTGSVRQLIGLNEELKGKPVIILEDIVDTGITIEHIIRQLQAYEPSEIRIASLLLKPEAYQKEEKIDYVGFEIPNKFIIGYGLDYDGLARNLKHIYQLID
ncbi:MAG: hypoxanthine phosphoribosyltransferase [Bacteroidales bacterium]|jgi:hypoxanthine phosphoribosyltransferase|nr:hypoxanthine phosphoribosyltransferase [Bacteroidales bacterium]